MRKNKRVIWFSGVDKCEYYCIKLPAGFYRVDYTFSYSNHTTFSSRIVVNDITEAPKLLSKIFQLFSFYLTNKLN